MLFTYLLLAALATSTQGEGAQGEPYVDFGIVPDIIPEAPPNTLQVTYNNSTMVNHGNDIDPMLTIGQPVFQWPYEEDALYTLIMIDPDVPSKDFPVLRSFLHFLAMDIKGNNVRDSVIVAHYLPPTPLPWTGAHRYLFLLYKQTPNVSAVTEEEKYLFGVRVRISLTRFVKDHGFGTPTFGNFHTAKTLSLK